MLTPAQIAEYHERGYLILRGYLSPDEVAAIQRESRAELDHQFRHQPFDGTLRHFACMNDDAQTPVSARLLEDPRFFAVAEQLHGAMIPVWSDSNRYVDAVTPWHPDVLPTEASYRMAGVKFAHYLQPLTAQTGALRVIPGSHRKPLHDELRSRLAGKPVVEAVDAYVCETMPGDVIAFCFATWHASCGGAPDRRMNTLAFYPRPGRADDAADLVSAQAEAVAMHRRVYGWRGEAFPEAWIARAAHDPRRRAVVARLQEAGLIAAMGGNAAAAERVMRMVGV